MDTIAAIATAAAPSAIGVVRVSGENALAVLDRVFTPANGKPMSEQPARTLVYGAARDAEGRVVDHALAVWFAAERSYTGEPSAELHCHGSPVVLDETLRAAFAAGARQAQAGEFTKRAFLNGRMDLTEAEAVVDLIDAETAEAARNAAGQVDGALRRLAERAYDALLDVASRFYAVVDYPDEDVEDASPAEVGAALAEVEATLAELLATHARGKIVKNGVATAIVGAPNAGKSSLLNRLVGYDRAIVTPVAGTTRDTVEETALVGGVLLRLIDTAGLRETDDAVERLGVERSRRAVENADLILALADGSRARSAEDEETLALAAASGKPYLLLRTKSDLGGNGEGIAVSSVTGEGLDALEAAVAALFPALPPKSGTLLTNARQADAVARALASVRAALDALRSGMTPDAVLTEAEAASNALGELTGRTAREDMVARIFERFCVGK
ncbi:MAG: tRNA uridine-5-carboxymethylaminomethyl(34) synthesis GTPase MnmE [Oscillospiraceae bacterium]|nr:tRNA uridine-5-carboxymethylaminomethyl(34) synthesis GTPase MnmE [Oscillospiraceae bacterium]